MKEGERGDEWRERGRMGGRQRRTEGGEKAGLRKEGEERKKEGERETRDEGWTPNFKTWLQGRPYSYSKLNDAVIHVLRALSLLMVVNGHMTYVDGCCS